MTVTEDSYAKPSRTRQAKRPQYSPLYERLVSREKYRLFQPLFSSSATSTSTTKTHKFTPSAQPLTSSHRKNDSRWSEILPTSIMKDRQFVTGGLDGYSSGKVECDPGSVNLGSPLNAPTGPGLTTLGISDARVAALPSQGTPGSLGFPALQLPGEYHHRTVADEQHSSYSELAANIPFFSESKMNRTEEIRDDGPIVGPEPRFHRASLDYPISSYASAPDPCAHQAGARPKSPVLDRRKGPSSKSRRYSCPNSASGFRRGRGIAMSTGSEVSVCAA